MMTNKDKVRAELDACDGKKICDDCLARRSHLKQRQIAYSACAQLSTEGLIGRERDNCAYCRTYKLVSWSKPKGQPPLVASAAIAKEGSEPANLVNVLDETGAAKPWHWEGNIQSALVAWLSANGFVIQTVANTATKEAGVDVVAIDSSGTEWWISVKGYPEATSKTSPNTQARHCFSHAIFDVVTYRNARSEIAIGAAFPDGYVTYRNLREKVEWLKTLTPFSFFWVGPDGNVRTD